MCELVVASQGQLHSNSKRLNRHDRNSSNGRANRQVYQRVLLPILRRNFVYHEDRENGHGEAKEQETLGTVSTEYISIRESDLTRLNRIVKDLINSLDLLVRRRMKHNDHRSNEASRTSQFPQSSQLLLQEV